MVLPPPFPANPRTVLVEMQIGATDWANITNDVYSLRAPMTVDWGVPGEHSNADPFISTFMINNRLGRYSPRNPNSIFYKQIGRNTPVRWSIGDGAYGLVTADASDGSAWTPDSVATSITGDIDIRVDLEMLPGSSNNWTTGAPLLASKYENVDGQRSWQFSVNAGKLLIDIFPLGTLAGGQRIFQSSVTMGGLATGRRAVRVTMDVDNGAAGATATFYTAPTMAGPWTQLGTPVTTAGVLTIFDGPAGTRIGGYSTIAPKATFYSAEIRNGINGSVVASPDFTLQQLDPVPFASSSFTDANGNTWTPIGSSDAARIWYGDADIRAWGETSSFPNRWDTTGTDAWVPLEVAGFLRRFGRRTEPAAASVRAWVLGQNPNPISYFPLSGSEGTTYSLNLGTVGRNSYRFFPETSGTAKPLYTYGKEFGSAPWLGTGMEYNASGDTADLRADIGVADRNFKFDFVFQSPVVSTDSGVLDTNIGVLDTVFWNYNNDRIQFRLNNSSNTGTAQVFYYEAATNITTAFTATAPIAALLDNDVHACRFEVEAQTGVLSWRIYIDGVLIASNSSLVLLSNWNGTSVYQMFYSRYVGQTVVNLSHLTFWTTDTGFPDIPPLVTDFVAAVRGYSGETAGARMQRIAALAAVPLQVVGDPADTMPMGPQYSEPRLTQIRDAENADLGILYEPRGAFGLAYRTRVSMVGQTPALTLNYAQGHLVNPFEPTDDDQLTVNDMTVARRGGDSFRAVKTTGRLSVSDPPVGVGQYADQTEVNVETEALLGGIATWLVNRGTVDMPRYPSVTVDLGNLVAAGGVALDKAARAVKVGDLIVITDLSMLGIYEDVRLLVLGGSEAVTDGGYRHRITWNCMPYQGFEGAVYATDASTGSARYDTAGSTLTASLNTTATTFQVAATNGVGVDGGQTLWTTDPAAFPFDVVMDGERMTVGAISGATSPQTFSSVTRSVNGVVRSHSTGAAVSLATPSYYSL